MSENFCSALWVFGLFFWFLGFYEGFYWGFLIFMSFCFGVLLLVCGQVRLLLVKAIWRFIIRLEAATTNCGLWP